MGWSLLKQYKYLLVDLDGVVWRGSKPLYVNIDVLKKLSRNHRIIYLTNNSTRSRQEYVYRLSDLGLDVEIKDIITSGYLAAQYIRRLRGNRVFIVGEAGLFYEVVDAGLIPITIGTRADHVVVGLDRFLTYSKVAYAVKLILEGSSFIASNADNVYPTEDGVEPGAGSIVAMIREAVGREPDMVVGKPNPWVIDFIVEKYGIDLDSLLIIGDRVDIDVYMGVKRGVDTLYVLTGVGKRDDIEKYGIEPTYVAEDLREFYRMYQG